MTPPPTTPASCCRSSRFCYRWAPSSRAGSSTGADSPWRRPELSILMAGTAESQAGGLSLAKARALVIVPTYNERENIARLIETVLAQDPRLEVLVVDDGSPDGTAEIVDGLMMESTRIHIHRRARKLGL